MSMIIKQSSEQKAQEKQWNFLLVQYSPVKCTFDINLKIKNSKILCEIYRSRVLEPNNGTSVLTKCPLRCDDRKCCIILGGGVWQAVTVWNCLQFPTNKWIDEYNFSLRLLKWFNVFV